jgi:hypothetical protein
MDPEEYRRLEDIASREKVSVGELIRIAVRDRYFSSREDKKRIIEDMLKMAIPVVEWDDAELEIEEAHSNELH